jgi:hypothetical protein
VAINFLTVRKIRREGDDEEMMRTIPETMEEAQINKRQRAAGI